MPLWKSSSQQIVIHINANILKILKISYSLNYRFSINNFNFCLWECERPVSNFLNKILKFNILSNPLLLLLTPPGFQPCAMWRVLIHQTSAPHVTHVTFPLVNTATLLPNHHYLLLGARTHLPCVSISFIRYLRVSKLRINVMLTCVIIATWSGQAPCTICHHLVHLQA